MIISSLILRYFFSKLRRFSKNPHCYDSCLDATDLTFEIITNLGLAASHVLSVVLPSNKTKEQKAELEAQFYKKDTAS